MPQGAARFCNSGNNAYLVEESNLWNYETVCFILFGGIGVHDGHCTTVAYLDHNWGYRTMAVNFDEPLQEFFDRFELPIRSVEFMCINMGGQILSNVRFYIIPCDSVVELEKQRGILLDKCSLFSRFVFPWNKEGYKDFPDYETIHRSIPELRKDSMVLLPWKEEYKEVIGRYLVQNVQYNWDENDEKRLK